MTRLLTTSPKVEKGERRGYLTAITYLAPASLSGVNVCPFATAECIALCLNTAGRGGIFKRGETTNAAQQARIARTRLYTDPRTRPSFFTQLQREITAHKRRAKRRRLTPVFRLNGTSDLDWLAVIKANSDVQFYDYTKSQARAMRFAGAVKSRSVRARGAAGELPSNYHLTYSRTEYDTPASLQHLLDAGVNVAVPYVGDMQRLATVLRVQAEVVSGDVTDLRFLDPQGGRGVLVALTAKGRARYHVGGFVVDCRGSK